jgi:hypothetical protein
MKRIKVNTTWEEDEEEQLQFFASLSYSERLRYFFKLRNASNFHQQSYPKGKIFKVYRSHDAVADELEKREEKKMNSAKSC